MRTLHNVGYAIVGEFWLPNSNVLLETNRLTFTIIIKGRESSLAILVFGTRSIFDRRLPRGFHPSLLGTDVTRISVQSANDTATSTQVLNKATPPSQGTNTLEAS